MLWTTNTIVTNTKGEKKMKTTQLQKIESTQKRWDTFHDQIMHPTMRDKDEHKGQTLDNGMTITGIGKKCLKIENNFYDWEDIEAAATEGTDDTTMQSIVNYLFEDQPYTAEKYTPKKWEPSTPISEVKEEILAHKAAYKTGFITGIGDKAVKAGVDYDARYVDWDDLQKVLDKLHTGEYNPRSETIDMDIIKQWYIIDDTTFLNKEEQKVYKETPELVDLLKLYEQGKLQYTDIQKQGETPEHIAEIIETVFKWNNNQPIPFTLNRKGKPQDVLCRRGYPADNLWTPVLHRSEALQKYVVSHIAKHDRTFYPLASLTKEGLTLTRTPCSLVLSYNTKKIDADTLKQVLENMEYKYITRDEDGDDGFLRVYDADNEGNVMTLRAFPDIYMGYVMKKMGGGW